MINHKLFRNEKKFLLLIFCVSLFIRIIAFFVIGDSKNPQLYEHGEIAKNMYNNYGFTLHWPYTPISLEKQEMQSNPSKFPGAFIPPLNPYIIYISFLLFGITSSSIIFLSIINAIFSSIGVIFVYLISRELFNKEVAIISSLIALAYLPNIFGVTTFSGAPLYQTLALMYVYFFYKSIKIQDLKTGIFSGITAGLLCLVRSEFLIIGIALNSIIIIYYFFKKISEINYLIKLFFILNFSILIITSPWIYRNTVVFGKFTTIVSHPWHEVWRGNNPLASGGAYSIFKEKMWLNPERFPEITKEIDKLPYNQNFELAVDSIFKKEVLNFWKEQPLNAAITGFKRLCILWSLDPYTPRAMDKIYLLFTVPFYFLFFYGLIQFFKKFESNDKQILLKITLLFIVFYSLLFTIVNFETRYQIYLINILLPFSGVFFKEIYSKFKKTKM